MTPFLFLLIILLAGIFLWVVCDPKFSKASRAGFIMFVIALGSICYGTHPIIPPTWMRP